MSPSLADLTEIVPNRLRPPLDRDEAKPTDPDQKLWRQNGYLILEKFLPNDLIDAYCRVREREGQWRTPTPYMKVREILDLCLYPPLARKLEDLISEPMGLHLNLTNWTSTERDWHQDDYLNPSTVNAHYAAVWMALEDINPDSGPFEYIPGSHRWPAVRREKVLKTLNMLDARSPSWPSKTQRMLSSLVEEEIRKRGANIHQFIAKKGDVLIWHGWLYHRGSIPRVPGTPRRSLISHYTGISRRPDFRRPRKYSGGYYFPFLSGPRGYKGVAHKILRAIGV